MTLLGKRIVIRRVNGCSSHADMADRLVGLIGTVVRDGTGMKNDNPYIRPDELCARVLGVWDYLSDPDCPHRLLGRGDILVGVSIMCEYDILDEGGE